MKFNKTITSCILSCCMAITGCHAPEIQVDDTVNSSFVVNEYDNNLDVAKSVETSITDYLLSGNLDDLSIDDKIGSSTSYENVVTELKSVSDYIAYNIKVNDEIIKSGLNEENYVATDEDYYKSNLTTKYFMDKDSGSVEQYFILYDRMTIYKLSLNWVGGVIADAKVSRYN